MALINFKHWTQTKEDVGGVEVPVIRGPRPGNAGLFSTVMTSIWSLLKGMGITISYLVRPSTVVTQQYPENRETLQMFDRYRAQLKLRYDEEGLRICNCCMICQNVCPNGSINILSHKNPETKKKVLDRWIWRLDSCTFCNACVQACPSQSIEFGGNFESSVYDRRLLIYSLNEESGPDATALKKLSDDPAEHAKQMERINRYSGEVPLGGKSYPGNPSGKGD